MRMSLRSSSARRLDSSTTASIAYVSPAMNEILWATASCLPIGTPHWTRSLDHSRTIFKESFPDDPHIAGSDRRPVFSVVSATLSPCPSPAMMFSAGTRTSLKLVTPFSIPRSPMNWLRCSTLIPGLLASTTNALIPPR